MRRLVLAICAAAMVAAMQPSLGAGEGTAACDASAVHYRTDPRSPDGVHGIPWIASTNTGFHGYLFYFGGTRWARTRPARVRIFTTRAHVKVNPKVLWVARHPSSATLKIVGTRLDGPGSFAATYPAAIGGRQFPSYVLIPAAGCWRVSLRSGSAHGSVVIAASDKP